jgi:hypothetical protein
MVTGLKVEMDRHYNNHGGKCEDDEWTRDSGSYDNTFCGVYSMKSPAKLAESIKTGYIEDPDIVVGADVNVGDTVYIVWVEYGTGDSFGSDGGNVEYIAGFVDKAKAEECEAMIRKVEVYSYTLTLEDGSSHDMHSPWIGYFECLEAVHINETIVA